MSERDIVVISAGLSTPSSTRMLADRLAAATARNTPVNVRVVELRDHAKDIANNFVTGFAGPELEEVLEAVREADGLIAITPIFQASYSGLFKSFFDVLDKDALAGTPVVIGATGGSARHSLALEHAMRPMFAYLHAVVAPTSVYAASEDWATGGDSTLADRVERAAGELAALIEQRPAARAADPFDEPVPFEQLLAQQQN
ncbi:NADPH-dependent FMN reductase [Saccharopolyspora terrae]|jgi:FMN reductase|uniref:NADPH-dependent FMN reductase n=1 Tax=Saccharopolyspora terrae TaxID=2530384 RepID=A0A4R4VKS9_9PSEU|nr:FMN reductase [Saccharopolyspora terrae]TDD04477.1 NADPH-dependent FMN reductase [Saccharopolyspora terrae]